MLELLRSVWREPRPAPAPPRRWWDWALVGALVPGAVVEGVSRSVLPDRALSIVVSALLVLTLLWRRSAPLAAVVVAMGAGTVASVVVGRQFPDQIVVVCLLLLPFALFRWGSGRELVVGTAVLFGNVGFAAVVGFTPLGDAVGGVVVLSLAMASAAAVRYRTRARTRELEQVKLLERGRLARDLHDTVAHHVTAMAVRAQAGIATAATDPAAAVDALRLIESEAARALDEMRGIVRILRAGHAVDFAPSPRVSELGRLATDTGPAVAVDVVGDADDLPAPVAAAVFRLAQEAVTNARRHARNATRVEVRVDVAETEVRLRVSDDGDAGSRRAPGYGLLGMGERADLLGGTCTAGPNAGRGWTVTAVLPRTGVFG